MPIVIKERVRWLLLGKIFKIIVTEKDSFSVTMLKWRRGHNSNHNMNIACFLKILSLKGGEWGAGESNKVGGRKFRARDNSKMLKGEKNS